MGGGASQVLRCLCPFVLVPGKWCQNTMTAVHDTSTVGQYCTVPQTHCAPFELGQCATVTDGPTGFVSENLLSRPLHYRLEQVKNRRINHPGEYSKRDFQNGLKTELEQLSQFEEETLILRRAITFLLVHLGLSLPRQL